MGRLPSLKALQAFRAAGEQLSFKAAAEQLYVSQAAISQQIKMLEQQLGIQLFQRLPREVILTAEGRQLLSAVSSAFNTLEQGVAQLLGDPDPLRLTISTLPSFASRWLVPRLGRFQQRHPELTVSLTPTLELVNFDERGPDLAVRFGQGRYPGLAAVKLFDEYLVPVCHPSLVEPGRSALEQLTALPLLSDDAPDMESVWEAFATATGVAVKRDQARLHVQDSNMLVEAALSGQGLTLLRFSLTHELLASGRLLCPVPVYLKSSFDYYLVAPPAYFKRPKVMQFELWLRDEFAATKAAWQAFRRQLDAKS